MTRVEAAAKLRALSLRAGHLGHRDAARLLLARAAMVQADGSGLTIIGLAEQVGKAAKKYARALPGDGLTAIYVEAYAVVRELVATLARGAA